MGCTRRRGRAGSTQPDVHFSTNEFQAASKLAEAAAVLNREPISVTSCYLQTLIEIGTEQNTTLGSADGVAVTEGMRAPRP